MRFLHIAAVKCYQTCTCDGVRHQEEDGIIMKNSPMKELVWRKVKVELPTTSLPL